MRIGVAIDDLPLLSRDILVAVLAAEPDFQIVTVSPAEPDPVEQHALEVLIVAIAAAGFNEVQRAWLSVHPRLRLLGIEMDARTALLLQLRPHQQRLSNFSPQAVIELLRARTPASGAQK
jgi:hypothetical protein